LMGFGIELAIGQSEVFSERRAGETGMKPEKASAPRRMALKEDARCPRGECEAPKAKRDWKGKGKRGKGKGRERKRTLTKYKK
jgi:hypothetical protein